MAGTRVAQDKFRKKHDYRTAPTVRVKKIKYPVVSQYRGQTVTMVCKDGFVVDWEDGDRSDHDSWDEVIRTVNRVLPIKRLKVK